MPDTEKITINLSAVDLGRIDLLAEEGFYSNRTDFIRTAIRKELDAHADFVKQSVTRKMMAVGIVSYNKRVLERMLDKKEKLDIRVVGAVHISKDVTPDLARRTIQSLSVHGVLRASDALKDALADRMKN